MGVLPKPPPLRLMSPVENEDGHGCFSMDDHLASVFLPCVGLESVIWQVAALNHYPTKAFSESPHSISSLNTEVAQSCRAPPQNRVAFDVLTAAQGGTCAVTEQNAVCTSQIATNMSQDY